MFKARIILRNRISQPMHVRIRAAESAVPRYYKVRWRKRLKVVPGTYFLELCYENAHLKIWNKNGLMSDVHTIPSFINERFRGKKVILDISTNGIHINCQRDMTVFDVLERMN